MTVEIYGAGKMKKIKVVKSKIKKACGYNDNIEDKIYSSVDYAKGKIDLEGGKTIKRKVGRPANKKALKAKGTNEQDETNFSLVSYASGKTAELEGGKTIKRKPGRPANKKTLVGKGVPDLEGGNFFTDFEAPFDYIKNSISNLVKPSIAVFSGGSIWDDIAHGVEDVTGVLGHVIAVPFEVGKMIGGVKNQSYESKLSSQIKKMRNQVTEFIKMTNKKVRADASRNGITDKNAIAQELSRRISPLKAELLQGENDLLYNALQRHMSN